MTQKPEYIQKREQELKMIKDKWGDEPFTPDKWRRGAPEERAKMCYDLLAKKFDYFKDITVYSLPDVMGKNWTIDIPYEAMYCYYIGEKNYKVQVKLQYRYAMCFYASTRGNPNRYIKAAQVVDFSKREIEKKRQKSHIADLAFFIIFALGVLFALAGHPLVFAFSVFQWRKKLGVEYEKMTQREKYTAMILAYKTRRKRFGAAPQFAAGSDDKTKGLAELFYFYQNPDKIILPITILMLIGWILVLMYTSN